MKCSLVKQHIRKPKKMERDTKRQLEKEARYKRNVGIWKDQDNCDDPRSSSER